MRPISNFVRKVRPRVVVSLSDTEASPMMNMIVALAREWEWDLLDYSLVYGEFPNDPAPAGALIDELWCKQLGQLLHQLGCPTVRLGSRANIHDHLLPAVLPDIEAAGQLAARHFLERSFENLVYIGWNADSPDSNTHLLYKAYAALAAEYGVSVRLYDLVKWHRVDESPAGRFERRVKEIGGWLETLPRPMGLLTYSDEMAAKLCVICRRVGLNVPEEVAILGFGNTTWCDRTPVALSSIMLNEAERAKRAMHLLRDMMEGKAGPAEPVVVPPEGIRLRRSTDVLALGDLTVAKALGFIWEHSGENVAVGDVAMEVGLSARQLERRFRQSVGRTVNQELVRRRLEAVKRLLRTTTVSVTDIAPMTGFRSTRHLHHSFRQATGITPVQFRLGTKPSA